MNASQKKKTALPPQRVVGTLRCDWILVFSHFGHSNVMLGHRLGWCCSLKLGTGCWRIDHPSKYRCSYRRHGHDVSMAVNGMKGCRPSHLFAQRDWTTPDGVMRTIVDRWICMRVIQCCFSNVDYPAVLMVSVCNH